MVRNRTESLPRFLDTPEAARIFGIPASTLVYWRGVGEGPNYVKIGRRVKYELSELLAWLRRRNPGPPTKPQAWEDMTGFSTSERDPDGVD